MTDATLRAYDPVAVSSESTVVAEYELDARDATAYQSEAALEAEFIQLLQQQAYEYLPITTEVQLVANLRAQLEALNSTSFSDAEWDRFYRIVIASPNSTIVDKAVLIHEDNVKLLTRDDGTSKNITLIDKTSIHNNRLQVINQYEIAEGEDGAAYANRYDVTVLVNGLPMVHVELKRRGVKIREAFNQIARYQRDSFWSGSGLFEYVQLFVISNGTQTKYYSNTTRRQHVAGGDRAASARRKASHSFEFTSWWADATNKPIADLTAFAKTFFAKHTLLNVLTRYCVLDVDRRLLVMRPYQIVATERILQRIDASTNSRTLGTVSAGGYVWHTTGSGKTLTSFKTAQLASSRPDVDKVIFVVDRKDLDYQTMREYDRFQKGSANSNTSTAALAAQLARPDAKIIITTIQKLATFVRGNAGHAVFGQHVVLIFDECHRSQFGEMHTSITKAFNKYNLFGFTGTPIFSVNAGSGGGPRPKTTEQAFGDRLHTYTIVDAITDKNVLPFRIDYLDTVKMGAVIDKQVSAIDTERALLAPERISRVVSYTLEHFAQKTRRSDGYQHDVVTNVSASTRLRRPKEAARQKRRVSGFNALFATASIEAARAYYAAFRAQQAELPQNERLKIATIFSYGANDEVDDSTLDDEAFDTAGLDFDSRRFLDGAIADYNALFGTSYDTSADSFQNYYKDLSQRLKNRELDLVIVVNMFLTGFDATTLNTLFVDKNLRAHGLIQAFSRTNRILNSVKTYGNIVAFRDLQEETNTALELFGNKDARGIVVLKPYAEYYDEYVEVLRELSSAVEPGQKPIGEAAQKRFISLMGQLLRLRNILVSFDDFAGDTTLSARDLQDYSAVYNDLRDDYRRVADADREGINDDVIFEVELVRQIEVGVDYILMLVDDHRRAHGDGDDTEVAAAIDRAIGSSPTLRNKRDLIEAFVRSVSAGSAVEAQWDRFVAERREKELEEIIAGEGLRPDLTRGFMQIAMRDGVLRSSGTALADILPPVSRFAQGGGHLEKRRTVIARLTEYVDRYFGLGG